MKVFHLESIDSLYDAADKSGVYFKANFSSRDPDLVMVDIMPVRGTSFELADPRHRNAGGRAARRPAFVCRHGYAAFIEALLREEPDCHVETPIAKYRGLADFEERQPAIWQKIEAAVAHKEECGCK